MHTCQFMINAIIMYGKYMLIDILKFFKEINAFYF